MLSPVDKLGTSSYDLSNSFGGAGGDYAPERHGNMPKQYSLDALRQRSLGGGGGDLAKEIAQKNFNLGN